MGTQEIDGTICAELVGQAFFKVITFQFHNTF